MSRSDRFVQTDFRGLKVKKTKDGGKKDKDPKTGDDHAVPKPNENEGLAGRMFNRKNGDSKIAEYDVKFATFQKGIPGEPFELSGDELDEQEKQDEKQVKDHLPGQHDQEKHGRKKGGSKEDSRDKDKGGSKEDTEGGQSSGKTKTKEEKESSTATEPTKDYGSAVQGSKPPEFFDDARLGKKIGKYRNATVAGVFFARNEEPTWSRRHQNVRGITDYFRSIKSRYEATQKELQAAGVEEFEAYRGMDVPINSTLAQDVAHGRVKVGDRVTLQDNEFASYSLDQKEASQFADFPIPTKMPNGEATSLRIRGESIGLVVRRVIKRHHVVAHPGSKGADYKRHEEVIGMNDGSMEVEIMETWDVENVDGAIAEDDRPESKWR